MATEKKKSFILYVDRQKELSMLSDEQAGKLFKAIFEYVNSGTEPDFDELVLSIMFSVFKSQLDANAEKYEKKCEKNRQIALERERKKREQNSTNVHERTRDSTKSTDTDTDNDTVTDNDTETVTGTVTDTEIINTDNYRESDAAFAAPPTPPQKKQKEVRHKYGEYGWVKLTDSQYQKLISEYGEKTVSAYIKRLDEYCQQNNNKNKYSDWNMTMRRWMNRDNVCRQNEQKNAYDEYEENQDLPF